MQPVSFSNTSKNDEESYRLLVEHSPVPVFINFRDSIVYMNAAGVKLLGAQSATDILGRSPLDFIAPQYHDQVRARIARILSDGGTAELLEEEFIRVDSKPILVSVSAAAFPYQGGRAVQVHFTDISEQKGPRKNNNSRATF